MANVWKAKTCFFGEDKKKYKGRGFKCLYAEYLQVAPLERPGQTAPTSDV